MHDDVPNAYLLCQPKFASVHLVIVPYDGLIQGWKVFHDPVYKFFNEQSLA